MPCLSVDFLVSVVAAAAASFKERRTKNKEGQVRQSPR